MMNESAILGSYLDQGVREIYDVYIIKKQAPRCVSLASVTISDRGGGGYGT